LVILLTSWIIDARWGYPLKQRKVVTAIGRLKIRSHSVTNGHFGAALRQVLWTYIAGEEPVRQKGDFLIIHA